MINKNKTITFKEPIVESASELSYNIAKGNIPEIFASMRSFCIDKTIADYTDKRNPIPELDYNLIRNIETEEYNRLIFHFHTSLIEASMEMSKELDRFIATGNEDIPFSGYRNMLYVDYCNPSLSISCQIQIGYDIFYQILHANSAAKINELEYIISHTDYITDCSIMMIHIFGERIYESLCKTVDNLANENMLDNESIEKIRMMVDKVFSNTMQSFTRISGAFMTLISSFYRNMIETRKRMFC